MMQIKEIIKTLEHWAPPAYQASYDNSGLLTGQSSDELSGVVVTLDCTEAIVDEAIAKNANLIVAHHPIIFNGLKSLTGKNYVERTIIKAIKNNVAIYSIHTNLDHVLSGVNKKFCEKIGLEKIRILVPKSDTLSKLVTFVPKANAEEVVDALHVAGAGHIGNYDECIFQTEGMGSFRPNENSHPHIGKPNVKEIVSEMRVELIFPSHLQTKVLAALKQAHPYEEVAYYVNVLLNENQQVGAGMIGELKDPVFTDDFFKQLKKEFGLTVIRHTRVHKEKISKIAVCGGAGSFLLSHAKAEKADMFITADFKYHEFFDAENKIIIADIGHYESEVATKELIYEFLKEKFANIAVHLSKVNTNPIKYS